MFIANRFLYAKKQKMISIKMATTEDVDIIVPLFEAYRIFYNQAPDPVAEKQFLEERISRNESVIFIASWDFQPVGFTQLYPLFSSVSLKRLWVLNDLYILGDYRKKGIATSLLETAKKHATNTGAKGLLLETGKENLNAQVLYQKNGWLREENYFYEYTFK
jgi:ribosomal protein S18 acetylase RimI-like enzyme